MKHANCGKSFNKLLAFSINIYTSPMKIQVICCSKSEKRIFTLNPTLFNSLSIHFAKSAKENKYFCYSYFQLAKLSIFMQLAQILLFSFFRRFKFEYLLFLKNQKNKGAKIQHSFIIWKWSNKIKMKLSSSSSSAAAAATASVGRRQSVGSSQQQSAIVCLAACWRRHNFLLPYERHKIKIIKHIWSIWHHGTSAMNLYYAYKLFRF